MTRETRGAGTARSTSRRPAAGAGAQAALRAGLNQAMLDAVLALGGSAEGEVLAVAAAAQPLAPAVLAQSHPAGAARTQAQAMYGRCLAHYRAVVRPALQAAGAASAGAGAALDDVGAAAAFFVATNLMVLHGTIASPSALLALERQLVGVVRTTSAWSEAGARERQLYFEKLAILGVYMQELGAAARPQGPAAQARLRQAARAYLHELLGLDGEALALGDGGLQVRSPAAR